VSDLIERLCAISRRDAAAPYGVEWPDSLEGQWCMSPELCSLYGTPHWEQMSEPRRRRLSLAGAVNFFSLNVHGERELVGGLARRLYERNGPGCTPYLHHFLDEENKHMALFGQFCERYAGAVYPDRKLAFPREHAPGEEDFLFYARVLVFEEIVDHYNRRMARDGRLAPVVREINRLHHRDEARHLAFGRRRVQELFAAWAPRWHAQTLAGVRRYLADYLVAAWREYYNPAVYRDAGFADAGAVAREAFAHPRCRAHRERAIERCASVLRQSGILEEVAVG